MGSQSVRHDWVTFTFTLFLSSISTSEFFDFGLPFTSFILFLLGISVPHYCCSPNIRHVSHFCCFCFTVYTSSHLPTCWSFCSCFHSLSCTWLLSGSISFSLKSHQLVVLPVINPFKLCKRKKKKIFILLPLEKNNKLRVSFSQACDDILPLSSGFYCCCYQGCLQPVILLKKAE